LCQSTFDIFINTVIYYIFILQLVYNIVIADPTNV